MEFALMESITTYAKKKNVSKNKVIEAAVKKYLQEIEKIEFIKSLKAISDDPDIIEMSEWGMKDYAGQIKKYEQ
jgi:hypothetical protein